MRDAILQELDQIEQQHDVTLLVAVESGSRAWGFPSVDSDYDVRFLYVHPADWYLSIEPGRDVIELPAGPVLDINGWDLRKALQLLRKSNISIQEWLSSPIRYRCDEPLYRIFETILPRSFQPDKSARHYLSMAKTNLQKTRQATVRMKAYLYALRPLLCSRWILERGSQPPMLFEELAAEFLAGTPVGTAVAELIARKESQTETDTIPQSEVLNAYLEQEFAAVSASLREETGVPEVGPFDEVFRQVLAEATPAGRPTRHG